MQWVLLLVLGSHTGSIHRTGAIEEVVLARCNNCSSNLCLLFSPFEPRFLQQIRLHKNHNCGTVASYPWFKMVFNRACALQKSEAPKLYQFSPERSRFELGKIRFFSLLIWRFMASGILLQFDTSHHAVVVLLVLEATLVLPIRTGASVEVVKNKVPNIFFHGVHVIWPIWAEIFMAVQI